MDYCKNWNIVFSVALLNASFGCASLYSTPIFAETQGTPKEAAKVIAVSGTAYAVSGNSKRALDRRSPVYNGEVIHTGKDTKVQLRFVDDALVSLKENSEFKVDNYNYDSFTPENNTSALELVQGGFWTVTGQIADISKDAYSVSTNFTTIGVRGTFYGVAVKQKPEILRSQLPNKPSNKAQQAAILKAFFDEMESNPNHAHNNAPISIQGERSKRSKGYSAGEPDNATSAQQNEDTPNPEQGNNEEEGGNSENNAENNSSEVFAVLSGEIEVTNNMTQETISMDPSTNQFVQVTNEDGQFQTLTNVPNGLSDNTNNPTTTSSTSGSNSANNNTNQNQVATNDLKSPVKNENNNNGNGNNSTDNVLILNTTQDLRNPPNVSTPANTASQSNNTAVANAGTVILTADELASLTGIGAVAMTDTGYSTLLGLSSGALGRISGSIGNPVITNAASLVNVSQAASVGSATQGNCQSGTLCQYTMPTNQTVYYGFWNSAPGNNALLRDGPVNNALSNRVNWIETATRTPEATLLTRLNSNYNLTTSNNFTTVPLGTGFVLSGTHLTADTGFELNLTVNFPNLNNPNSVTGNLNISDATRTWSGNFTGNYLDSRVLVTDFANVTLNQVGAVTGRLEYGFIGPAGSSGIGAINLNGPNAGDRFDAVFASTVPAA